MMDKYRDKVHQIISFIINRGEEKATASKQVTYQQIYPNMATDLIILV
jgi:hypothetical protein